MNTYLLPIDDEDCVYIESVNAVDLEDAKAKFIDDICESYSCLEPSLEWEDFVEQCLHKEIFIGEIYDKEEF